MNEPAYVLPEDDPLWVRSLRIDECLSHVRGISAPDIREAKQALADLPVRRLRSWLQWIEIKEWTGPLLLAFFAFHRVWDATERWWEVTYWDNWLGCWCPAYNRLSLTLDNSYELVKARLAYPPSQMIDDAWHEDWERHTAWRHGFKSFAEFALFRALEGDAWCESLRQIRIDREQTSSCYEDWAFSYDPWAELNSHEEERDMQEEDLE